MIPQQLYVLKVSGWGWPCPWPPITRRNTDWRPEVGQPHKPQGLVFARFNKNKNLYNSMVAAYKQTVLEVEHGERGN